MTPWVISISPDPSTDPFIPAKAKTSEPAELWVGAYLASWSHFAPPTGNWGNLPADEIDWDAFTHLYYFAFGVGADGSLSGKEPYENMGPDRLNSIVTAAHNAKTPVLFSVGGWGNYENFSKAITPEARQNFIDNLLSVLMEWQFDGIDLDMEPIKDQDSENYTAFVKELHGEMQKIKTPLSSTALLTAATSWKPNLFSELQQYFDQINLMTYDMSGAWGGWVTWHNAPVYSGDNTFPGTNRSLPSLEGMVADFINAGVKVNILSVGIDFYGYIWSGGEGSYSGGVSKPNQSWVVAPQVRENIPYHQIMDKYYQPDFYNWDEQAGAAYLSITQSEGNKFISYDEERAVQEKIKYALKNELGGIFIWELSAGYRKNESEGKRDLLLQSVKNTLLNSIEPFNDTPKQNIKQE